MSYVDIHPITSTIQHKYVSGSTHSTMLCYFYIHMSMNCNIRYSINCGKSVYINVIVFLDYQPTSMTCISLCFKLLKFGHSIKKDNILRKDAYFPICTKFLSMLHCILRHLYFASTAAIYQITF